MLQNYVVKQYVIVSLTWFFMEEVNVISHLTISCNISCNWESWEYSVIGNEKEFALNKFVNFIKNISVSEHPRKDYVILNPIKDSQIIIKSKMKTKDKQNEVPSLPKKEVKFGNVHHSFLAKHWE